MLDRLINRLAARIAFCIDSGIAEERRRYAERVQELLTYNNMQVDLRRNLEGMIKTAICLYNNGDEPKDIIQDIAADFAQWQKARRLVQGSK